MAEEVRKMCLIQQQTIGNEGFRSTQKEEVWYLECIMVAFSSNLV